jgi:hypothetical protein
MSWFGDFRERKRMRRERLRKFLFGDAPRPKPLERVLLPVSVAVGGFVCYYFRLVHAHTFGVIGFGCMFAYFVLRRLWWSRKLARPQAGKL